MNQIFVFKAKYSPILLMVVSDTRENAELCLRTKYGDSNWQLVEICGKLSDNIFSCPVAQ